jgi:hypothetical protein
MTVKSYKVGPGELTLGAVGPTLKDWTPQVTSCTVEWEEDVEDSVPTLSGEELDGEPSYSATLTGTFVQDISADGLIDWTWTNKGTKVPFTYTPNSDEGASFSGVVRIRPLNAGGDVKTRPTVDFEWACIGEPVMAHGL